MYYPVQIPYMLSNDLARHIQYSEEIIVSLQKFVICFWEIKPRLYEKAKVNHIIITDGCIDLVVLYSEKQIGYSGMSKTNFTFEINLPCHAFGLRLKPGAFYQLTGLPATNAMDTPLSLEVVDNTFDTELFFSLSYEEAKDYFFDYACNLICTKEPESFVRFFDELSKNLPTSTMELYQKLHFSPRQSQRHFLKYYGITPQTALSILRFQKCLDIITSDNAEPSDVLGAVNYYDQPHFIKDFKKNIGITPFELIRKYRS